MTTKSGKRSAQPLMGRPRVTSRAALERLAFDLFAEQGFEETTVDEIAAAAGIGRRTFFRYFASKNDLVWGDFEEQLETFRKLLAETDPCVPLVEAVRRAVVEFNRFDVGEVPWHRQRMQLILRVPALQADSTLRYASWRDVVREFVAERMGLPPSALIPRLAGYAFLSASIAAYEHWLSRDEGSDLSELLDEAIRRVGSGLGEAPYQADAMARP